MIKDKKAFKPMSYNELISKCISFIEQRDIEERNIWLDLEKWILNKEKTIKSLPSDKN